MRKLLSANLHHLVKTKVLWITAAFSFCYAVFTVLQGGNINAAKNLGRDLDFYYFQPLYFSGMLIAVLISLFIGTEYSDGTIRNKLIIGHKRNRVYLSNLLTCYAGVFIVYCAWAIGGLAGIPYFGLWSIGIRNYFLYILIGLLSVFAITAILVLEAQLISNKAHGVIATIFTALALLLIGSYFYNALWEPEMTHGGLTISSGGVEFGPEIANPAYIGGALRKVYEAMLYILPTGQHFLITGKEVSQPLVMCGCSLAVMILSTVIGLFLFRKKDIR